MSLINSTAIPSGVATGYEIEQSLRFNDDDSPYLSWIPASASNRKTWTFSAWIKRGNLGVDINLLHAYAGSGQRSQLVFATDNTIKFDFDDYTANRLTTTQVFRDASSWFNIVLAVDTTQGTAANRVKMYVNGNQITDFSAASYPSQNEDGHINEAIQHEISSYDGSGSYLDGYLAEVNFVDGAAKAPADFGKTGTYGQWKPKKYSGSYGTNGYYLPFKQDYTVEGFSTVLYKGNGGTQYIGGTGFQPDFTWIKRRNSSQAHSLIDSVRGGNKMLESQSTGAEASLGGGMAFKPDGFTLDQTGGWNEGNANGDSYVAWNWDMGTTTNPKHQISAVGNVKHSTTQHKIGATSIAFDGTGDRLDIPASNLMESDEGTIECWIYMNALVSGSQVYYHPAIYNKGNVYQALTVNSSGTVASYLYTGAVNNLESSVNISTGAWNHVAVTWNSSGRKIWINGVERGSSNISLTSMQTAGQNSTFHIGEGINAANHVSLNAYVDELRVSKIVRYTGNFTPYESARGEDNDTQFLLHSNADNNSTSFVDSSDGGDVNADGSIESIVAANPTYGQSIVTYTGTGSNATVGHGLSSAPEMIISFNRGGGQDRDTYHASLGATKYLRLSSTVAAITNSGPWNNTTPTSSVISLGNRYTVNQASRDIVLYCFHSVSGYSKFGSYEGTGSSGKKITTGFAPAFVMVKNADATSQWRIIDTTRDTTDPRELSLFPDSSEAEAPESGIGFTVQSDGFTWQGGHSTSNASGNTHIYMAFADKREYAYWLDQSGNNNDWTSNNLTESDIMVDSPTNNFATLNPIYRNRSVHLSAGPWQMTLSEGNLKATGSTETAGYPNTKATMTCTYNTYVELYCVDYERFEFGLTLESFSPSQYGSLSDNIMPCVVWNGEIYLGGSAYTSVHDIGTPANGSIIGMAVNPTTEKFWISFNGTWSGTGTQNPATGDGGYSYSFITSGNEDVIITVADGRAAQASISVLNFGQDSSFAGNKTAQGNQDGNSIGDFYYTPPTGFLALCTSNLPDAAVIPSENFNTVIYSGNNTDDRNITGVGFAPNFVWIKSRNTTNDHLLFDSVRGVGKYLRSNVNEGDITNANTLQAFASDGFQIGSDSRLNTNNDPVVAWNWKAATAFSNDASATSVGSIDSAGKVNVAAGFSIIGWAGTGSAGTIAHGLSKAPEQIWVKNRNKTSQFAVYYGDNTDYLALTDSDATADYAGYWNDTSPTSTVFSVGSDGDVHGASNQNVIAYCFHSVDGYSKVGSYVANGNEDGAFVYLGFRPAFLLRKKSNATGYWIIQDNKRPGFNTSRNNSLPTNQNVLYANTNGAEVYNNEVSFLSNGFKATATDAFGNTDGATIEYYAVAETPFKYSNAR